MNKLNFAARLGDALDKTGPRISLCGGAICYTDEGKRTRVECSNRALSDHSLCFECAGAEAKERKREQDRIAKASVADTGGRRGRL